MVIYRRKQGFTLAEILVVVAILAVLTAIAVPTYLASKNKAVAAVCVANRRSLSGELNLMHLADDSSFVSAFAQKTAEGTYTCPEGCKWKLQISDDGSVCAVLCTKHSGNGLDISSAGLNQILATTGTGNNQTNGSGDWREALKKLLEEDPSYQFPTIQQSVLDACQEYYKKQGKNIPDSVLEAMAQLTWKPAVADNEDKSCIMIASSPGSASDSRNDEAALSGKGSYSGMAYLVYDGKDYYLHINQYNGKPDANYVSDSSADLSAIQAGSNGWVKIT